MTSSKQKQDTIRPGTLFASRPQRGERREIVELQLMLDADPTCLTVDADGQIWFAEPRTCRISTSTRNGTVSYFRLPSGLVPSVVVAGSDGRVWFTTGVNRIGAIDSGGATELFSLVGDSPASGLGLGGDGNIWFTRPLANVVGRIGPGGKVEELRLPTMHGVPQGIAAGNGSLWVAQMNGAVARITLNGQVTELALPLLTEPLALVVDGAERAWITGRGSITRLDAQGSLCQFALPISRAGRAADTSPAICVDTDERVWFTLPRAGVLGSLTPDGVFSAIPMRAPGCAPFGVTLAVAGAASAADEVWFTQRAVGRLGRIRLAR